jgi:hypothetical protein
MANWFRRSNRKDPGQDFREVPTQNILERLSDLEKALFEVKEKLEDKYWSIDKVIIEKMHADKVEFNLDKIDVKDLSGMLSIGMNYGGKQIKMESTPAANEKKTPEKKSTINDSPEKTKTSNKDDAPGCHEGKENIWDSEHEETVLSSKTGPVIKMRFK